MYCLYKWWNREKSWRIIFFQLLTPWLMQVLFGYFPLKHQSVKILPIYFVSAGVSHFALCHTINNDISGRESTARILADPQHFTCLGKQML